MGDCLCKNIQQTSNIKPVQVEKKILPPAHEDEAIVKQVHVEKRSNPSKYHRSLSLTNNKVNNFAEEAEILVRQWRTTRHYRSRSASGVFSPIRSAGSDERETEKIAAMRREKSTQRPSGVNSAVSRDLRREKEEKFVSPFPKRKVSRVRSPKGTTLEEKSRSPGRRHVDSIENPLVSFECFIFL